MTFKATANIDKWTHSWVFYHALFWLSIAFTLAYDIIEYLPYDPVSYFASLAIRIGLSAGLVYGNLYFLIPRVFEKNRFLYWILLGLMTALFILFYRTTYFTTTRVVSEVPIDLWSRIINRFIVAVRFLLFSLFMKFIQDWFKQEKKISEITTTQLTTELKYLRSQINPHFLFNTLNNIYSLTLKKSDKAPEVVMRLSEMMEYMLYENDEMMVSLEKEIMNLSNYLEIERIRQGNNAIINFEVTGKTDGKQIAPLLFLPLLENAVKHGINRSIDGAFLKARISVEDKQLTFSVENNSPLQDSTIKRDGIGIQNLKKRLELFYSNCYALRIEDGKDRYKVELTLLLS